MADKSLSPVLSSQTVITKAVDTNNSDDNLRFEKPAQIGSPKTGNTGIKWKSQTTGITKRKHLYEHVCTKTMKRKHLYEYVCIKTKPETTMSTQYVCIFVNLTHKLEQRQNTTTNAHNFFL